MGAATWGGLVYNHAELAYQQEYMAQLAHEAEVREEEEREARRQWENEEWVRLFGQDGMGKG